MSINSKSKRSSEHGAGDTARPPLQCELPFAKSTPFRPDALSAQRLLRLKDVRSITGLGRSTIYRWMETGRFPKPVRLGPRSVAWIDYEIEAWVTQRGRCSYPRSSSC